MVVTRSRAFTLAGFGSGSAAPKVRAVSMGPTTKAFEGSMVDCVARQTMRCAGVGRLCLMLIRKPRSVPIFMLRESRSSCFQWRQNLNLVRYSCFIYGTRPVLRAIAMLYKRMGSAVRMQDIVSLFCQLVFACLRRWVPRPCDKTNPSIRIGKDRPELVNSTYYCCYKVEIVSDIQISSVMQLVVLIILPQRRRKKSVQIGQ